MARNDFVAERNKKQDTPPDPWELRGPELLRDLLARAAKGLEMDAAFIARFDDDRLVFQALGGDAGSFGWEEGGGIPLEGSYCKLVADDALPNAVPDARAEEAVRDLEVTREAGIGSYVGFPLRLSDGSVYGTLCCASHTADPRLAERDLRLMKGLAGRLMANLERDGRL